MNLKKQYEEFAIANFNTQTEIKNFLTVVSIVKFTTYTITNRKTFTAWENCVVDCMGRKYRYHNAVDWIQFGINPGADILWKFASCGWDCY